jgi:hypothetical protein
MEFDNYGFDAFEQSFPGDSNSGNDNWTPPAFNYESWENDYYYPYEYSDGQPDYYDPVDWDSGYNYPSYDEQQAIIDAQAQARLQEIETEAYRAKVDLEYQDNYLIKGLSNVVQLPSYMTSDNFLSDYESTHPQQQAFIPAEFDYEDFSNGYVPVSYLDYIDSQALASEGDLWDQGGDLAALVSLTSQKPITSDTVKIWTPTAILSTPWAVPTTTRVVSQANYNAATWHNDVITAFPGLSYDAQSLLTMVGGFQEASIDDLVTALVLNGLNTYDVTAKSITDNLQGIKSTLAEIAKEPGFELEVQSLTSQSEQDTAALAVIKSKLDLLNPGGVANGVNDRMIKTFPELAMTVLLGVNDITDAINFMNDRDVLKAGGGESGPVLNFLSNLTGFKELQAKSWYECTGYEKGEKLGALMALGDKYNINPELIAKDMLDLIGHQTPKDQQADLYNFITSGAVESAAAISPSGSLQAEMWKYIQSDDGAKTIGLVAAGAMVLGGVLTLNPALAVGAAGTSVFAIAEIANYTGMADFRVKASLESQGMYPPSIDEKHEYKINDVEKAIERLKYDAKSLTPDQIAIEKEKINKMIDEAAAVMKKDSLPLIIAGTYSEKLNDLAVLKGNVRDYIPNVDIVDPITGKTKTVSAEAAITQGKFDQYATIKVDHPEGTEIRLVGTKAFTKADYVSTNIAGKHVIEIYKDGNLVGSKEISLWDPDSPVSVSFSKAEVELWDKLSSGGSAQAKAPFESVRTVQIPEGTTAYLKSNPKQILEGGKTYDIARKSNVTEVLVVSGKGKQTNEVNLPFYGADWEYKSIAMKDAYQSASQQVEGKQGTVAFTGVPTAMNAKIFINGKEISKEGLLGYAGEPGQKETITVTVKVPFMQDYTQKIYLNPGQRQMIDLTPTKPVYTGGAAAKTGGGGGSGGGGGGSSKPAPKAIAPTTGMIVFGDTYNYKDITTLLDDKPVVPIVGQTFTIAPGYHNIYSTRPGMNAYSKQIYVGVGDTITVNATWELLPGLIEPVLPINDNPCPGPNCIYRVTFSTTPQGAKILIGFYGAAGQSDTGQWTPGHVDLKGGLYMLRIYKSGFNEIITPMFIGPVCSLGGAALTAGGV